MTSGDLRTSHGVAVRLGPVPDSAPAAMRWPGVRVDRTVSVDQPPLPWLAPDEGLPEQLIGRHDRTGAVRIVRFGESWAGPTPDQLPDPGPWSASLALALSETLRGARPIGQLNRWLSPATFSQLTVQASRRSRRRTPPVLQAVHLQRSGPEVVEVVALFREPNAGLTALAFRLEVSSDRWLCTALETRPTLSRPA